jgi:AcrR family transcriptional regulator
LVLFVFEPLLVLLFVAGGGRGRRVAMKKPSSPKLPRPKAPRQRTKSAAALRTSLPESSAPSSPGAQKKSELTRARVLKAALALFRRRGFADSTMREVAEATGLSLGAAYYYFPSKEAILFAYYARNRAEHDELARARMRQASDLVGRLRAVLHAGLDTVAPERKMLGALVRRLADPTDPLSAFSDEQRAVRRASLALFVEALEGEPLSDGVRGLVAHALWFLLMGLLLYFVHDRSPKQERTRRLVDDAVDFVVPLIFFGSSPLAAPFVEQLRTALSRAGLLDAPDDAKS